MEGSALSPGGRHVKGSVLAERLNVCRETISTWVKRGLIPPPVRVNKRVHLFDLDATLAALERLRQNGGAA